MKTKNTMTKRFEYRYNELDSLAEYLEKQADDGWELTSKTGVMLGFRKTEPRKVKISVQLLDESAGDWQHMQYIELCEAAGWNHIFSDGKIQIFENESMDAPPIDTDPQVKLGQIHKRCLKSEVLIPGGLMLALLYLLKLFGEHVSYMDFLFYGSLGKYILVPLLGILLAAEIFFYFIWYLRAKKTVERGAQPKYVKHWYSRMMNVVILLCIFGSLAMNFILTCERGGKAEIIYSAFVLIGALLLIIGFPYIRARKNDDRTGDFPLYFCVAIIFGLIIFASGSIMLGGHIVEPEYKDNLLLTTEMMGIQSEENLQKSESHEGTVFLEHLYGSEYGDGPGSEKLFYSIFETKYKKIYDMVCKENLQKSGLEYKETDEPAFGAQKVYQCGNNYVLLSKTRCVEFGFDEKLTESQKKIVGEKLLKEGL